MEHKFPESIYITYAVCKKCNNREFIVSGQSQICNNCGEILFGTDSKIYTLKKEKIKNQNVDTSKKSKIVFPEEVIVGYAKCSNALNGEEVVVKDIVICQECIVPMIIEDKMKYFLSNKTYKCLICGYDVLYDMPYQEDGKPSFDTCPNCKFRFTWYDEKKIEKYREKWKKKIDEKK